MSQIERYGVGEDGTYEWETGEWVTYEAHRKREEELLGMLQLLVDAIEFIPGGSVMKRITNEARALLDAPKPKTPEEAIVVNSDVQRSFVSQVREFHEVFGVPIAKTPTLPPPEVEKLRIDLIEEEFNELKRAFEDRDLVQIADALADLHYVISGTSLACGIPEDACFEEVHRSNMSKAQEDGTVLRRADGKVLKSSRYTPPELRRILLKSAELAGGSHE